MSAAKRCNGKRRKNNGACYEHGGKDFDILVLSSGRGVDGCRVRLGLGHRGNSRDVLE